MRSMVIALLLVGLSSLAACGSRPLTQKDQVQQAFDAADRDQDEQLTAEEFTALPLEGVDFAEIDSDNNARISLAELESFLIYRRVKAEGNRSLRELQQLQQPQRRY